VLHLESTTAWTDLSASTRSSLSILQHHARPKCQHEELAVNFNSTTDLCQGEALAFDITTSCPTCASVRTSLLTSQHHGPTCASTRSSLLISPRHDRLLSSSALVQTTDSCGDHQLLCRRSRRMERRKVGNITVLLSLCWMGNRVCQWL
jgi:hypothetical protein